ncbi:MAG: hypothetical protein ACI4I1_03210 [Oscillospiraceae bacterium]
MNCSIEELCKFQQNVVSWIEELLLRDEIRLRDIPSDIRRVSDMIYISAFRTCRSGACNRFISNVNALCEDIKMLYDTDDHRKMQLIALLGSTLQLSDYKGDERFEAFKRDMDEAVLQQLHDYENAHGKQLEGMLREYLAENRGGSIP